MLNLRVVARVLVCIMAGVSTARAQSATDDAPSAVGDSIYLRARSLVLNGDAASGRRIVDSMVAATAGTREAASALYWRAALAATAADAERDYRRVIVDYPFAPHAGDALLALAQLEMARGDRAGASEHLRRFLRERPRGPDHVRVGMWLGRLLLEQNDLAGGCAVLLRTRSSLGDDAVEIRNQLDFSAARCAAVDTSAGVAATAAAPMSRSPSTAGGTASARAASPPAPVSTRPAGTTGEENSEVAARSRAKFAVQLAALRTRAAADELVARLAAQRIEARVVSANAPPFRVRTGYYATDAEARAAARALAGRGHNTLVVTMDLERGATSGAKAPH